MDRRTFLKLTALTGLGVAMPLATGRAQSAGYDGPFWALVNAGGAWDPRFLFDPILDPGQNRLYTSIAAVGNISYAPLDVDLVRLGLDTTLGYETMLMSNQQFLTLYGSRLTVLNGVDTATNNHDAGNRAVWSGTIPGAYPSLGALIARSRAPDQPMAFISGGGYDATAGLVPLARVDNPDTLGKVAFVNQIDPGNVDTDLYHTPETLDRIQQAQRERLGVLAGAQQLPRLATSMRDLEHARLGVAELSRLTLPAELVTLPGSQLDDLERMQRQAQLAVAGFASKMAAAATISLGGFDTHADHDQDQSLQVVKLLAGIHYLMSVAAFAGVADRMYVIVASDFGRGPFYNSDRENAGKDHWPITSMMVMGPGLLGDRVIGATDGQQNALNIDPATLTPVTDGGVRLTPEVVHRALRRVAGVEDVASDFPLAGQDVNLFG